MAWSVNKSHYPVKRKVGKSLLALAVCVSTASPAVAQWLVKRTESAFGGPTKTIAMVSDHIYSFGFVCEGSRLHAVYMPPEAIDDDGIAAIAAFEAKLLVRVDDGAVREIDVSADSVDGRLRLSGRGGSALDAARDVHAARRSVSVALKTMGHLWHEHRFTARRSTDGMETLLSDCGKATKPPA